MSKIKAKLSIPNAVVLSVFASTAFVALIVRFYQLVSVIDASTGFFSVRNWSVPVLYGVLAVGCAAIAVMALLKSDVMPESLNYGKSVPLCVICIVVGLTLVYDWGFSLVSCASLDNVVADDGRFSAFRALMRSGLLPLVLQSLFALLSSVYFFILAASFKKGSDSFSNRKLLALMPVGWCIIRLIFRFVRQISYVNVSDLLLELFLIAFMMLFFMAFAQLASRVYDEGVSWRLAGFGLPAAVLCVVTALPRLVFTVSGNASAFINDKHPLYPCDIAIAVFIVLIVCSKALPTSTAGEIEEKA